MLDDRAATVAHRRAGPESAPAVVVENLRRAGVSLVERWNNALARDQRLVSSESPGDRTVEVGL